MLTLRQTQWFSFKVPYLGECLFSSPLHNLKKRFIDGKFYTYYFLAMRTRSANKLKRRLLRKTKLQMMAAVTNSKCSNKTILNPESSNGAPGTQCSSGSPDYISRTGSKQEHAAVRDRSKESIKSDNESDIVDKRANKDPSKQPNETVTSVRSRDSTRWDARSRNMQIPVLNDNFNSRYQYMWPPSYDSFRPQNYDFHPAVYHRSFSDSRIYRPQLDLGYLNNSSRSNNHCNRYRMHRSNTPDSSNRTSVAARERQLALSLRSWQRTPLGKRLGSKAGHLPSCKFTIMSYNILAQELLTQHSYLYREHNSRALVWERRWSNLLDEIKYHNADILCLQEVQSSHLESYFAELNKLGYKGLFKERTGRRADGCAIYYKTAMFNLIEHATVEFKQSSGSVLNRDNVAIIAKFAHTKNQDNEFVVATTHLLYNPKREDVRLAQTQVLLTEIDRISYKKNKLGEQLHLPIIMTGDFNLTPTSPVYELITRGVLRYEYLMNKSLLRGNATYDNITGKQLLPAFLQITDRCQHAGLVEQRNVKGVLSREDELKLIHLQNGGKYTSSKCSKNFDESLFSTGTLSHNLALKSAYEHRHGDAIEATTFQDKWVTVDYIFYSGVKDENDLVKEDKLQLISRYMVPTNQQLEGVKIPNFGFGSDHISLVVQFKLDP